ncbi:MAG: hypothetical protein ACI4VW_03470 [Acutalibacteraceae bacterium]
MNNKQELVRSLSGITKTYLRVSKIKTALTFFLVGYAAVKVITAFAKN